MKRLSNISLLHYIKLFVRTAVFLIMTFIYIRGRLLGNGDPFGFLREIGMIHFIIFGIFAVEVTFRFFPSRLESMGCQKQFAHNYIPTVESEGGRHRLGTWRTTLAAFLSWIALNGAIAALYYTGIIDEGILVLIFLFYSVSDMICILFFCPFQTWIMKNKCCGSCRIYNWDYAMMFTPLALIPHPMARALFLMGLLLLIVWEITVKLYPERFDVATNGALRCQNCPEKLCHHKAQLRAFLRKNRERFRVKENIALLADRLQKKLPRRKKKDDEEK